MRAEKQKLPAAPSVPVRASAPEFHRAGAAGFINMKSTLEMTHDEFKMYTLLELNEIAWGFYHAPSRGDVSHWKARLEKLQAQDTARQEKALNPGRLFWEAATAVRDNGGVQDAHELAELLGVTVTDLCGPKVQRQLVAVGLKWRYSGGHYELLLA